MKVTTFIKKFLKSTASIYIYQGEADKNIYVGAVKDLDLDILEGLYISGVIGLDEDGDLIIMTSAIDERPNGDFVNEVHSLFDLRRCL